MYQYKFITIDPFCVHTLHDVIDSFHLSFLFTVFTHFIHHAFVIISSMFHFGRSIFWEFFHSAQYVKFSQSSSLVNFLQAFVFKFLAFVSRREHEKSVYN